MTDNGTYFQQNINVPNYDIHLPIYDEQQWAAFDNPGYPLPPFNGYNGYTPSYAYTVPSQYIVPVVEPAAINPMQTIGSPTSYDSPPDQAPSPSIHENAASPSESGSATPRGSSPIAYANNGLHHSGGGHSNTITAHPNRHSPYNLTERARPMVATNTNAQEFSAASLLETWVSAKAPENAVFKHSSKEEIRDEMNRLAEELRDAGLSSYRHHPFMRCPVYDCERGGHNPLLHGPPVVEPTEVKVEDPDSDFEDGPIGTFFALNEIIRHVRSKHAPEVDLRCDHPGCPVQYRLDSKAGGPGQGRFCRADVLRVHLRNYPEHKESVSVALKNKYKLWRD